MKKEFECKIIEDLMLSYIDDTLNIETKEMLEKHISECDNCKKKLEDFKSSILENQENDKQCINYLKKAKMKERLKTIRIIIIAIIVVLLVMYFRNFIIFNSLLNKADKSLENQNIYIQWMEKLLNNEVVVTRKYYKDGKYKQTIETYSDNNITLNSTLYSNVNSDETIRIDEINKKIIIQKGEETKMQNLENNLKFVPFVNDNRLIFKIVCPSFMHIRFE